MLDKEWINLILEAKHIGLTIEDIRAFLQANTENEEWNKEEVLHSEKAL